MKPNQESIGQWVQGRIDEYDIPVKTITSRSGVHPSTFSRFVNGVKPINEKQIFELGAAFADARREANDNKSGHDRRATDMGRGAK